MITTIDRAGRIVIPKAAREAAGLREGEVEIEYTEAGVTLRVPTSPLVERDGRLRLRHGSGITSPDEIRELRLGLQR
ncbi:MAG: AbrB/MazE/SpoVT family DNA-binding domain-containing protein [Promicromonosporaceae bacterium]|nr:AbrB/MazE/SpoVT family DNA-binding domain-containing protein [Promicromonosporaceae bacterium]